VHWRTRDPDDPRRVAHYGHEHERGAWVELVDGGARVAFDQVGGDDAVLAIVGILVEFGFVGDAVDVEDAFRWSASTS
jgi:hypothetical protein